MSNADFVLNNTPFQEQPTKDQLLEKIQISKRIVLKNSCTKIDFKAPIISREGQGIIYPNTINIIQGKSGSHKSRLAEILIGLLLSKNDEDRFLGFEANRERSFFIAFADTERNLKEQFPYAIQHIKRLAGIPIEEENFMLDPFSFIDIERSQRFAALQLYLEDLRERVQDHLVIVLDVVTDCIGSFNDPKESLRLIDLMNAYINNYDVTFICVIHENPMGGDKARGHLGTELDNKSSTVLQIGFESKESDLIRITFKKCRSSKRYKPIYLVYSEDTKGLILADQKSIDSALQSKNQKARIEDIIAILPEALEEPSKRSHLLKSLADHFNCGTRILEDRIKHIHDKELLITDKTGQKYILDKYTEKRNTFYTLTQSKT